MWCRGLAGASIQPAGVWGVGQTFTWPVCGLRIVPGSHGAHYPRVRVFQSPVGGLCARRSTSLGVHGCEPGWEGPRTPVLVPMAPGQLGDSALKPRQAVRGSGRCSGPYLWVLFILWGYFLNLQTLPQPDLCVRHLLSSPCWDRCV
jgi:hypothetical protein